MNKSIRETAWLAIIRDPLILCKFCFEIVFFISLGLLIITNLRTHNLKSDIEFLKQTLDKEDSNVIMRHEHMIRTKRFGELTFNDKVFIGE